MAQVAALAGTERLLSRLTLVEDLVLQPLTTCGRRAAGPQERGLTVWSTACTQTQHGHNRYVGHGLKRHLEIQG